MNLLILKGFNNYFNRIIKRYTTLADYKTHSDSNYDFSGINFNPNDGVTTTQIIGSTTQQQTGGPDPVPLAWEHDGNPDYLIVYETEQVGNTTINTIKSRWFIVESVRTCNGQYSLKLKRDSIADFFESLLSCPAFIKKGTVSDDNPLIVNSEGITVNQIKSGETLLKDQTGSAWLVGYMPKNGGLDGQVSVTIPTANIKYETIENLATELDVDATDLSNILTTNQNNPAYFINDNIEIVGWVNVTDGSSYEWRVLARSQDNLTSVSYGRYDFMMHTPTSDCFAKEANGDYWSRLQFSGLGTYWKNSVNPSVNAIKTGWKTWTSGKPFFTRQVYDKLKSYVESETLIYKAGKYYKLKVGSIVGPTNTSYPVSATTSPFSTICSKFVNDWNQAHASSSWNLQLVNNHSGNIFVNYNELTAYFYLQEVSASTDVEGISFSMSSTRNACMDQVYDMFAIPFSNVSIEDGINTYEGIGEYSQQLAVAIAEKMSDGDYSLYDLQLLPYCPIPEIAGAGNINITGLTSGYDYDYITQTSAEVIDDLIDYCSAEEIGVGLYQAELQKDTGLPDASILDYGCEILEGGDLASVPSLSKVEVLGSTILKFTANIADERDADYIQVRIWWKINSLTPVIKSIIIYPKRATFSVNINQNLVLKDSMKIEALCNNYRLVSPNYQGSFDFNVAKNGGTVNGFIADCTYKPYTPYIKVAPLFNWLYGVNFGDCRGLICAGDFSLGRVNSAWESYEMQNKNYQNIFNREIQNLDVAQSIQRTQQYLSGGLNIVRDTIAGGVGGGLATGSPYGAIAGAAIGGIGSGIGYGVDMNLMEKGLQEQRQFSIDKYKMQLGNIQALPYTLTKVGAFNINSKVWPFLEYYTCSEQEKEALRMKIQYEGMTVGIVDVLGNYINNGYVQADLIRNETIIEDSHLLDDIYIELTKGVYM
jgi:hypothetical protein